MNSALARSQFAERSYHLGGRRISTTLVESASVFTQEGPLHERPCVLLRPSIGRTLASTPAEGEKQGLLLALPPLRGFQELPDPGLPLEHKAGKVGYDRIR